MASDSTVDWIVEHLLKLVELFVVVPVGIGLAVLALLVVGPWTVVRRLVGDGVPEPPGVLVAVVRWPYRALLHIFTGKGGFQWTPTVEPGPENGA